MNFDPYICITDKPQTVLTVLTLEGTAESKMEHAIVVYYCSCVSPSSFIRPPLDLSDYKLLNKRAALCRHLGDRR